MKIQNVFIYEENRKVLVGGVYAMPNGGQYMQIFDMKHQLTLGKRLYIEPVTSNTVIYTDGWTF